MGPRGKIPEEVEVLFGNCIRQVNIGSSTTEGMKKQETSNKLGPASCSPPLLSIFLLGPRLSASDHFPVLPPVSFQLFFLTVSPLSI
jgi:hypothetical protein